MVGFLYLSKNPYLRVFCEALLAPGAVRKRAGLCVA